VITFVIIIAGCSPRGGVHRPRRPRPRRFYQPRRQQPLLSCADRADYSFVPNALGEGIRLFRSRWRQGLGRLCLPGQVCEELVERVPLPGLRRREGLKGIGEILMVRAVGRGRQCPLLLSLRRKLLPGGLPVVGSGSAAANC
jgi:hypothetical protein